MLKARIRNVLGVENAEFEIKGITLIGGRNGEGKSSLLQAVAAAALADASIRSLAQKAQRGQAVREGADLGVALLDWGTGSQRVVWPAGTIESTGQPFAGGFGSPLGIGAREWSSQESKTRATEFALRAKATPTVDDIRAFLEAQDGSPAQAEALWARIDISGWDSVLKAAQEAATKLKGAWENVAGVAFGPLKSKNWRPAILLPDERYTVEAVTEDLDKAREARERLVAAGAVETHKLSLLKDQAANLSVLQAKEKDLRSILAERRAAQDRLTKQGVSIVTAEDFALACPHCSKAIEVIAPAGKGPAQLRASPKPVLTAAEARKRREESASVHKAAVDAQAAIDEIEAALAEHVERVSAAATAASEVRRIEKAIAESAIDGGALSQARELVARLEERLLAVKAMLEAEGIFGQWAKMQPALQALHPENGVRAVVAARALAAWNETMATIASEAGLPPVALTESMELTLNGRRFALLSESEKWRANFIMTLAIAKAEGAKMLLVDRLDVLVSDLRAGILKAIRASGIPALVAMSVPDKSPERLPHLSKAGLGSVHWIEKGVVTALPY